MVALFCLFVSLSSPQACIDGSMDMVSFLLEHNANVNQVDSEGWTPLHVAASCGHTDIAECVVYVSTVCRTQLCNTVLFATLGVPECGVGARVLLLSTILTLLSCLAGQQVS